MRLVLQIWLLLVYTLGSVGLNLQLHYCGGELSAVNFFIPEDDCCSCTAMSDCCSSETLVLGDSEDHHTQVTAGINLNTCDLGKAHEPNFQPKAEIIKPTKPHLEFSDLPPPDFLALFSVRII